MFGFPEGTGPGGHERLLALRGRMVSMVAAAAVFVIGFTGAVAAGLVLLAAWAFR